MPNVRIMMMNYDPMEASHGEIVSAVKRCGARGGGRGVNWFMFRVLCFMVFIEGFR